MERAAELLLRTDKKIIQIAEEVGYHDMDYFVNRFYTGKRLHTGAFQTPDAKWRIIYITAKQGKL